MLHAQSFAQQAADALRGVTGFETRVVQFERLASGSDHTELVVCVVGITSSGKSTFLNALMGEALLPEQAKATTNLMVRCRLGTERRLEVRFRDGGVTMYVGDAISAKLFRELCSEDGNPGNRLAIDFLEWSSPRAVVPANLVLCDTPGLDAFGHEHHAELTLRRCIPLADIALYVTSIRKNLGRADLALVRTILENDQRVLFALTHADIEVDSFEGGRLYKSCEQKLGNHVTALQSAAREVGLSASTCSFSLVSSKHAKEARGDRTSPAWQASGFDDVVAQLEALGAGLRTIVEERRARRLIALLEASDADLEGICGACSLGIIPDAYDETGRARLSAVLWRVRTDTAFVAKQWREALNASVAIRTVSYRIKDSSGSTLTDLVADSAREWTAKLPELGRALDRTRREALAAFEAVGMVPSRTDVRKPSNVSAAFPSLDTYSRTESYDVRVRGWFDNVAFWPKSETRVHTVHDTTKLISDVHTFIANVCGPGLEHLTWWEEWMNDSLIRRADERLDELRRVAEGLRRAQENAQRERDLQLATLATLHALKAAVRAETHGISNVTSEPPPPSIRRHSDRAKPMGAHVALIPLLATFRELDFPRAFVNVLSRAGVAEPASATVLLLGRRRCSVRLLASLLHDRGLEDRLLKLPPSRWMASATDGDRLLDIPWTSGAETLPPSAVLPRLRVVIAPDDEHLLVLDRDWERVLHTFDAVGISLDAPRIDSGLSALQRAPYARVAEKHQGMFFVTDDGRVFDDKLHRLVTEVSDRLPRRTTGALPWLAFEDYDARYTDFLRLCDEVRSHRGTAEELARRWEDDGLPATPPFDTTNLRRAFDAIAAEDGR